MRRVLFAIAVAGAWACSGNEHSLGDLSADGGCAPSCQDRQCGSDGCGGSCGECEAGLICNPDQGACECSTERDEAFCARLGVVCGEARGADACGRQRIVACDGCGTGRRCDASTSACTCAESDEQLCRRLGKECGALAGAVDVCGDTRAVASCGACSAGERCAEAGNTCELCTAAEDAEFCAEQGKQCGRFTAIDSCSQRSRTADCGPCAPGLQCAPGTNACEPCTSESREQFCQRLDRTCGTVTAQDNCRLERTWDCGECTGTDACDVSGHCGPCRPESDAELCRGHQVECGILTAADTCGAERTVGECGPCDGAFEFCDPSGRCASCVGESDAQLCAFHFKDCGTPTLVDRCGQPRPVHCGSCSPPLACQADAVCGDGVAPSNDTCARPRRLAFDASGAAYATGDLTNAGADYPASCASTGHDVAFRLTLTEPRSLRVQVVPDTPTLRPIAYLRASCATGVDLACGAAASMGDTVALSARALPPGDYTLIVADDAVQSGAFTVLVSATSPLAPANDTCGAAELLSFAGDTATARGDTTDAAADYSTRCTSRGGGEVVYWLTLPAESSVTLRATADAGLTAFRPVLELRAACPGSGAALGCATAVGSRATLAKGYLAAGDYYVLVNGAGGSYGAFTLTATLAGAARGDTCDDAVEIPLALGAGGELTGSVQADTSTAGDDYIGSCAGATLGRDLVYRFTVPAGAVQNVQIDLAGQPGGGLDPLLWVRSACPPGGVEKGCGWPRPGETVASLPLSRLGAGTYYVFVDSAQPTAGPFTLTVTATEPPPAATNDTCVRPMPLVLTHGWASVADSTRGASDDFAGGCATASQRHNGGDLTYVLTTPAAGHLTAKVRGGAGSAGPFLPAVYLQTTCGDSTTDRACDNADARGVATATGRNLPAGTYYVVVDGIGASFGGELALEVSFYTTPSSDSCGSATALAFDANGDAVEVGDLCAAANDATNLLGGSCDFEAGDGRDVVYRIDLSAPKDLQVTFNPGDRSLSRVYLRTSCALKSSQLGCSAVADGAVNTTTFKNLAAGSYYVWLDNDAPAECGPFSARFHLADPPPVPPNDLCAAAAPLAFDATGEARARGTTESASDDASGSCGAVAGGPDVVYAFSLDRTQSVSIEVAASAGSALRPVVFLQATCGDPSTESGCNAAAGGSAQLLYPRLGAGTYYLSVDSWDRNASGTFELTVATSTPGPAGANDLCANATPLPAFDPSTGTAQVRGNTLDGGDQEASFCASVAHPWTGADLAYSFLLAADAKVTVMLMRDAGSTRLKPAVSIRRDCALASEVACRADDQATGTATVTATLASGPWVVLVDGLDGTYGPFVLEVTRAASPPLAGDSCGNPIALDFGGGTAATDTGDLRLIGLEDEELASSCAQGPWAGADLVYSLSFADAVFVHAQLATTTPLKPALSLRRTCHDAASEAVCAYSFTSGATVSLDSPRLAAGEYYLVVDAQSLTSEGPFALTVTATPAPTPPPVDDTCSAPTPIVFDVVTGAAHLTGDTRGASDDYRTCGPIDKGELPATALSGGDRVYAFTVATGASVLATLTGDPATPSYLPALYLRSICDSGLPAEQRGCDAGSSTGFPTVSVQASNLAAGTYYLIVDGQQGSGGLFALDVRRWTAPVGNTACSAAEPLRFEVLASGERVASSQGHTGWGAPATQGMRLGTQGCNSEGRELYYSFTTGRVTDLQVTLDALSSTFSPAVYLRADCADPASQVACRASSSRVALTKLRLPAGAYTLIVDTQYEGEEGPFSLRVALLDPPPTPLFDTCRDPVVLVLPASGATALSLTDSTLAANDDYTGGCATANNPLDGLDVVYAFTPSTNTQVKAKVTPGSGATTYRTALYLRTTCAEVSDDVCKYNTTAGSATGSQIVAPVKAGATYYLIVDGIGDTAGDYALTISTDDAGYLEGDACTSAIGLNARLAPNPSDPAEQRATVTGSTTLALADYDGTCKLSSGGELVYRLDLSQESAVGISVGPDGPGSKYTSAFYVRTACGDSRTDLYCVSTSTTQTPKSAQLARLPAGTYYLFVDANATATGQNGPFTATFTVRTPPVSAALNEACSSATPLSFDPGPGGTLVALVGGEDSTWALDDAQGSCYGSRGGDLVYNFTTNSERSFKAVVTPSSGEKLFKPVVYLRSACAQSAEVWEQGCVKQPTAGGGATLTVNRIAAGSYWLFVDSFLANAWDLPGGRYDLTVTLDAVAAPAPPANDNCPGARPIVLTGQAPSLTTLIGQTTEGATNDTSGCAGATGPDVVYSFELTAPARVEAKVTFSASGARPAVYLRQYCGSVQLACNSTTSANNVTASAEYLPAGRYFLWVDSTNTSGGTFQLDLTLGVPAVGAPPAGFLCGAVPALTRGVAVSGTTEGSQNSTAALGAACNSTNVPGPNVAFSYSPTQDGFFVATLLTTGTADLALWMTDRCLDGPSCLAFNNGGTGTGTVDFIRYYGLAGTTYYLVVDATAAASSGSFVLRID